MKKLATIFLAMVIVFSSGCGMSASGTTTKDYPDTAAPEAIDDMLTEDDFVIPENALQWQKRNAPIFFRNDFYNDYIHRVDREECLDLRGALKSIEVDVIYDREEENIIITPKDELGPLMFRFTIFCIPVAEMRCYACWGYLCEFMHNGGNDEWCHFFSECEPPDETTEYIALDYIDGEKFYLTKNVFMEVDSTIVTMLLLDKNGGGFNDVTI